MEPNNDHILGIGRYYEGQKLLALFNFADAEEIAWLYEEGEYTDLWTGIKKDAMEVHLKAHDFVWLYKEFEETYEDETDFS